MPWTAIARMVAEVVIVLALAYGWWKTAEQLGVKSARVSQLEKALEQVRDSLKARRSADASLADLDSMWPEDGDDAA